VEEESPLINIPVTKEWDDMDNVDGNRPGSITVHLVANDTSIQTAVLTAETGWSYTFIGLPSENEEGEIVYTVTEEAVPYYETEIVGTHIINHYKRILTSVSVRKVWEDDYNSAGIRPNEIVMTLSNGMRVTLNNGNGWSATINNLPVIQYGRPVSYSWTEQEVRGYKLLDVKSFGNITVFTNGLSRTEKEEPPTGKNPPKGKGNKYVTIDDYGTPLGVDVVINHVGDCFD
jgi:hypothetical protein